jgi:hypothetical protein
MNGWDQAEFYESGLRYIYEMGDILFLDYLEKDNFTLPGQRESLYELKIAEEDPNIAFHRMNSAIR